MSVFTPQFVEKLKTDHNIIRDYITGADHLRYSQLAEGMVQIDMTHSNIPTKHVDLRLDLHTKISEVKEKFRTHIGTPVDHQRLILKDNGRVICEMVDNNRMLGYYSVSSGMEIHIIDTDPFSLSRGGGLTDVSLVQKYKMSEEDYSSRKGTLRDYIREQKMKDPNFKLKTKSGPGSGTVIKTTNPEHQEAPPDAASVVGIEAGMRCEVIPGARRGTVRFVGEIEATGYWVGVQFDEPVGKSDGTVKGERKFECMANFGGFLRGKNVNVGDFPERDLMDSDDDDAENDENVVKGVQNLSLAEEQAKGKVGGGIVEEEEEEDEI